MHVGLSEDREMRQSIFEEIMAENITNLMKYMNVNVQETPSRMNSRDPQ